LYCLDRFFTWTNNLSTPILCRLDGAFVSTDWNFVFPNSTLSSRTRSVSDHVPICLSASSSIPCPTIFRLNNHLLSLTPFSNIIDRIWASVNVSHARLGSAGILALRLKRIRAAEKTWNKQAKSPLVLAKNCDTLILFLDKSEELRPLSTLEFHLRILVKGSLHNLNVARATYWRQHAKIKDCVLGDENSSYFHLCATVRLQKNQIKRLDVQGVPILSQDAMHAVLHDFFKSLIGVACPSILSDAFISSLSFNSLSPTEAQSLISPFSLEEIKSALWDMDCNSSPGPDGFGPAFYKKKWDLVKNNLLSLLNNFLSSHGDLRRINKSYIILIPKSAGATSPDRFRPISLQNCCLKLASKCLTNRLQSIIPNLISQDQTGFIKGSSASENFIYAAEIIQSCYKRKASAIVLKLDFHKAFDSISWEALDRILLANGFPIIFCLWIRNLNSSSQSAVILNGKPGRWIQCRRGLRQGNPEYPYLFNIVVDLLRSMLHQAAVNGLLLHPLADNLPCLVLQYADDTIIIIRSSEDDMRNLKVVLDSFSVATGLHINFHKSTFAPVHVDPDVSIHLAAILGYTVASFPQTYLSLPLSTHKLKLNAFCPYLAKFRKRLPGWIGKMRPLSSRAILVKGSLRSMASHLLSALLAPVGTLQDFDKTWCAFFWAGDEHVHGSQCKVAWEDVCAPTSKGGLGFRCLRSHNVALLMKFLSKIHSDVSVPWTSWFKSSYGWSVRKDLGDAHHLDSVIQKDLLSCLPTFRNKTKVTIRSGSMTSIWHDLWFQDSTLAHRFPVIFSHTTKPNASMASVCSSQALEIALFPRLSHAATLELDSLCTLLVSVEFDLSVFDVRVLRLDSRTQPLNQHIWQVLNICRRFPLLLRLGAISRRIVAACSFGWPIADGCSQIFVAFGGVYQTRMLARSALFQNPPSTCSFAAPLFNHFGRLFLLFMLMFKLVPGLETFGRARLAAKLKLWFSYAPF
jgi:hypothetical protein